MTANRTLHHLPRFDVFANATAAKDRQRLERIQRAIPFVEQGYGSRRLAEAIGVSRITALTYRQIIVRNKLISLVCGCGRDINHQGYCSFRAQHSSSRRAYLAQCAAQSRVRRSIIAARVRERREDSAWWWLIKQLTPHPSRERIARRPRQRVSPLSTCYPYIREGEEIELLLLVK